MVIIHDNLDMIDYQTFMLEALDAFDLGGCCNAPDQRSIG
jgi:hypothetical protein